MKAENIKIANKICKRIAEIDERIEKLGTESTYVDIFNPHFVMRVTCGSKKNSKDIELAINEFLTSLGKALIQEKKELQNQLEKL